MADGNVTIIKKKKVVGGHGHHGGAWKVAYADFVTAMMAFFLLMWLLNATTEKQRKGIADYFSPTIPIHQSSGGGDGPMSGQTVFEDLDLPESGQSGKGTRTVTSEEDGVREAQDDGAGEESSTDAQDQPAAESDEFELLEDIFMASSGESEIEDPVYQNVRTRLTDEGLVIELFDTDERQLFNQRSDEATELMEQILVAIAKVLNTVANPIAIKGHAFASTEAGSNLNWQLSTNRALVAKNILEQAGLGTDRVLRLTGRADREPIEETLEDRRNNRIEIVLIR